MSDGPVRGEPVAGTPPPADRVVRDAAFLEWRRSLPVVEVDGEVLRVVHGDRLADDDQLVAEWTGRSQP